MERKLDPSIAAAWQAAATERIDVASTWEDLAQYMAPQRWHAYAGSTHGGDPPTIYDETAIVAVEELASRLMAGIFPDGARWARFDPPPNVEITDDIRDDLDAIAQAAFRALDAARAGPELCDALRELVLLGTCCLAVEPGPPTKPVVVRAIPMADVWLGRGSVDTIGSVHVRWRMRESDARRRWPDAFDDRTKSNGEQRPIQILEVIESWVRDQDGNGWMRQHHHAGTGLAGIGNTVQMEGMGNRAKPLGPVTRHRSAPWIIARWATSPGSLYGTGPAALALPAARVLNAVMRLILAHGELALAGMWTAEDDGVLNPHTIRLEPGAIIPVAPGSRGLQPLQPGVAPIQLAQIVLEEHRAALRKALHSETVTMRTSDTPPTALEIQQRMRELARQIGPVFGRIWRELADPLLRRTVELLVNAGQLPDAANGVMRTVQVVPQSSLVRAGRADEMRRALELATAVAQLYGPAALQLYLPPERFVRFAADALDIPTDLVPPQSEIRAAAQRVGAAAGSAMAEQGSAPAAEVMTRLIGGR